jgi:hypothetical protein
VTIGSRIQSRFDSHPGWPRSSGSGRAATGCRRTVCPCLCDTLTVRHQPRRIDIIHGPKAGETRSGLYGVGASPTPRPRAPCGRCAPCFWANARILRPSRLTLADTFIQFHPRHLLLPLSRAGAATESRASWVGRGAISNQRSGTWWGQIGLSFAAVNDHFPRPQHTGLPGVVRLQNCRPSAARTSRRYTPGSRGNNRTDRPSRAPCLRLPQQLNLRPRTGHVPAIDSPSRPIKW